MERIILVILFFLLSVVIFVLIHNSYSIKNMQKEMSHMDMEQNKFNFRLFFVEKKVNQNKP